MSEPSLYLCCDCGGSKTAVAIADSTGAIVAHTFGGPSNFAYLGIENFTLTVKSTVEAALTSIPGLAPPDSEQAISLPSPTPLFAAAWIAVSGVDSPAAVARLTPVLAALLTLPEGTRLAVCNDTHLLAAPLALHPDVAHAVGVIAGTGSIVASFRRAADGAPAELARVGGWGWILGDEGGGFDVGREAVRQLLREHEHATLRGEPLADAAPDTLRKVVFDIYSVASAPELLTVVHDADPLPSTSASPHTAGPAHLSIAREKRLSLLAPRVFRAAFDAHDPLALGVLRATATALAAQIAELLRPEAADPDTAGTGAGTEARGEGVYLKLAVRASDAVVCFGGSLVGVVAYRDMVLAALAQRGHTFKYVEFIEDAATTGAKGLASQFSGKSG